MTRQSDIKRMIKAPLKAGETVYAVRMVWREVDGRTVQECVIDTRAAAEGATGTVRLG